MTTAAPGSPAGIAARLEAALTATLAALEAGDVARAATASNEVEEACAALARGAAIGPEELARCRALHARCAEAAARTQGTVVAALLQTATHRKASDAYGSTT